MQYFKESLRSEMELRFAEDMEQTSNKFKQQIQTVRMELDRALELAKLKASYSTLDAF